MATTDIATRIEAMLEPVAHEHGYELVAVEQAGGRKAPIIRVLLDREGGIDIDAIAAANRWIDEVLEERNPIPGAYTLEVSSPGIDRPLRKRADFERFAGETATVKARPVGEKGRSTWTGTIVGVEGDDLVMQVDGENVHIPLDDVLKARLKGVVSFDKEGSTK